LLDQEDPPARGVHLLAHRHVGRAGRQAEATVDAGLDRPGQELPPDPEALDRDLVLHRVALAKIPAGSRPELTRAAKAPPDAAPSSGRSDGDPVTRTPLMPSAARRPESSSTDAVGGQPTQATLAASP